MVSRQCIIPKNNSFFLFGARGTGKTSLIKAEFSDSSISYYIDLLTDELVDRYSVSPQALKNEIELLSKDVSWIIIDEIQKVPKLLNVVHRLVESKKNLKFILIGSSSRRLKQKGQNLLTGRARVRNLYPLTWFELKNEFNLSDALNWGTLPKLLEYTKDDEKKDYLSAYALTYVRLEIQQEQWVRKLEPFRKFLPVAAQMNGKPLNYSAVSRDVGVEVPTVKSYFEILEDTLLGFFLHSYSKSIRKQQRLSSKFYFFDLGVKKAIQKTLSQKLVSKSSEWGLAFEHFIICEIYRINNYYQKDWELSYLLTKDDFEIDLIITKSNKKEIYIKIKSTEKVHESELGRFSEFCKENNAEGMVISCDKISRKAKSVEFLYWQQALDKLKEL